MKDDASKTITAAAPTRSHNGMSIWDVSIEIANRVYTWAYVALVLGAALTAIATMSLFWASALRDKYADQQIETARRDAAKATENAGVARAAAALATERGNALEAEAEEARAEQGRLKVALEHEKVERLRFQSEFAWRTLSSAQVDTLVHDLSATPATVQLEFIGNDPEATFVAIQFERAFKAAGWTVGISANTYAGSVFFGITVPNARADTSPDATNAVRHALMDAQIGFTTEEPPPRSMGFGGDARGASIARLVIGSKATDEIIRAIQGASVPPSFHAPANSN